MMSRNFKRLFLIGFISFISMVSLEAKDTQKNDLINLDKVIEMIHQAAKKKKLICAPHDVQDLETKVYENCTPFKIMVINNRFIKRFDGSNFYSPDIDIIYPDEKITIKKGEVKALVVLMGNDEKLSENFLSRTFIVDFNSFYNVEKNGFIELEMQEVKSGLYNLYLIFVSYGTRYFYALKNLDGKEKELAEQAFNMMSEGDNHNVYLVDEGRFYKDQN